MQEVILQNNFIGAWFLENKSVCDDLIEYYETKAEKVPGKIGNEGKIDKSLKFCNECFIDTHNPVLENYHFELQKVCEEYIKRYNYSVIASPWTIIEYIKIQKYLPGEAYYGWHCERDNFNHTYLSRHLVFLTYLNDVTDAGETEFYYQKLKVRPQKGLTVIWPADWTHTHRGVPSMTQTKYITTGWYSIVE